MMLLLAFLGLASASSAPDHTFKQVHLHSSDGEGEPPWIPKGQYLFGPRHAHNNPAPDFAQGVAISRDGSVIAEGHFLSKGPQDQFQVYGYEVNVYTYVEILRKWLPLGEDLPLISKLDDDRYNVHQATLDMVKPRILGGSVAIAMHGNIGDDDEEEEGDLWGQVEVWGFGYYGGRGNSGVVWHRMGDTIHYNGTGSVSFGYSLSLSPASTVAVGVPCADDQANGTVHVYWYTQKTDNDDWRAPFSWEMVGSPLAGSRPRFGTSVAISGDGTIVVGAASKRPFDDSDEPCVIHAFRLDETTYEWKQLGQDIEPTGEDALLCGELKLSSDGMKFVVGAYFHDPIYSNQTEGHVRVYEYEETLNSWRPKGQDLDAIFQPNGKYREIGASVSISDDGDRVVLGVNEGIVPGASFDEYLMTFKFDHESNSWVTLGSALDGEGTSSFTSALSSDGSTLVVGAANGADFQGVLKAYHQSLDLLGSPDTVERVG